MRRVGEMRRLTVMSIRRRCWGLDLPRPRGRPKSRLCDLSEVAVYLHVSRATIYRLIDKGLPNLRVGWVIRFDLPEVLHWLEEYTAQGRRAHWTDDYPAIRRRDEDAAAEEPEEETPRPIRKRSTRRRIGPAEPPTEG